MPNTSPEQAGNGNGLLKEHFKLPSDPSEAIPREALNKNLSIAYKHQHVTLRCVAEPTQTPPGTELLPIAKGAMWSFGRERYLNQSVTE